MVNAMCTSVFKKVKHRISKLKHSMRRLRMANSVVIPSMGRWEGYINIGEVRAHCAFEVFPSGGNWAFLVGKAMQRAFRAVHNHGTDTVTIPSNGIDIVLINEVHQAQAMALLVHIDVPKMQQRSIVPEI